MRCRRPDRVLLHCQTADRRKMLTRLDALDWQLFPVSYKYRSLLYRTSGGYFSFPRTGAGGRALHIILVLTCHEITRKSSSTSSSSKIEEGQKKALLHYLVRSISRARKRPFTASSRPWGASRGGVWFFCSSISPPRRRVTTAQRVARFFIVPFASHIARKLYSICRSKEIKILDIHNNRRSEIYTVYL